MSSEESTRHNPSGAIGTAVLFENNRVRVIRSTIAEVRTKGAPANDA